MIFLLKYLKIHFIFRILNSIFLAFFYFKFFVKMQIRLDFYLNIFPILLNGENFYFFILAILYNFIIRIKNKEV